ncbi:MAG: CPBP family glutamic-type intramembrane protease [Thermoanaerobaculia bacterium]|nr:CPBP family glutamic-type intramembrane protease [Thermoanaerobaculia bacterium]
MDRAQFTREPAPDPPRELPGRYTIKEAEEGVYLTCVEAPEVMVRVEAELSVTAAAARKAPEGTIFLDGAAQGEPFLDLERQVYNLDHHEGCVRRFTLATCEQALVLVLRGLDLRERPWRVLANAPDLDTVLAIWVLLNSVHLTPENPVVRRAIVPLVRLEGVIDAQGLEMTELTGFPEPYHQGVARRLDRLRQAELELAGAESGPLEKTAALLHLIDSLVYPEDFFDELLGVEELARDELTPSRIVVVCRGESGIYELEPVLKRLFGRRLGMIALQKDERTYTLRQVDSFLPANLQQVYERLNEIDPAVRGSDPSNRWGGSGEIGGSPRTTGTDLKPAEIAAACREACWRPNRIQRLTAGGLALLAAVLVMAVGWLAESLAAGSPPWRRGIESLQPAWLAGGAVLAAAAGLVVRARRRRQQYGLQAPAALGWLVLAAPAVVAALAGGAWLAAGGADPFGDGIAWALALLLLPLAAELTFRGLVQGTLAPCFRAPASRWLPSWPATLSAALYALATVSPGLPALSCGPLLWPALPAGLALAASFVFGVALAMSRERAGSLVAPLLLHYLGLAAVLVVFGLS